MRMTTMRRTREFALIGLLMLMANFTDGVPAPERSKSKSKYRLSTRAQIHPEMALNEARSECQSLSECHFPDVYNHDAPSRICVYKCMSEECYQDVYGEDALENGEVDQERYLLFSNCFRRHHMLEVHSHRLDSERSERMAPTGDGVQSAPGGGVAGDKHAKHPFSEHMRMQGVARHDRRLSWLDSFQPGLGT